MKKAILFLAVFLTSQLTTHAWLGVEVPKDDKVLTNYGSSKQDSINGEAFNVFVWNIYKAKKEGWDSQFKSVIKDYDLFLLQEMLTTENVLNIFSHTEGVSFTGATSFMYKKDGKRTGVATGSKVEPTWQKFLRSKKREPVLSTPKITLFTKYPIKNSEKELLVVNIHAINFVSSLSLHSQLQDAADIIKKHNGPSVFAGDFNTWTLEKQLFLKKITKEVGMKEVEFKNDTRKKMFGFILDFIFVKNLQVLDSQVHNDLYSSDHKAISAQLKMIK
ncbi:hypothetical protein BIY24_12945 [Halobacteriovorax marinus]|uniref:endonuclease/exonuclease/phosphatase family protein n=1 Tax=Halobacteriovorax marinus TaxID=97084 RepID=UPI000BC31B46|nr:endonuclease/exonuclease/phosphatase family protein [Halobacteriovorax marinus]ATH08819.1 hypothetical protein BIY24_12945 [Halobacteriovorax marinus]